MWESYVSAAPSKYFLRSRGGEANHLFILDLGGFFFKTVNCVRQEGPAILISKWLLRMLRACVASFVWTSTKNEWNSSKAICDHARSDLGTCNFITRVLIICHVKVTQSTAFEQKRFDLRSLSPILRNLWLLLV